MKNAVIISGQPRNVIENFDNINNFILKPNNDPDVFIHSWISDEIFGKQEPHPWITYKSLCPLHKSQFKDYKNLEYIPVSEKIPKDVGNIILNLYKPKKYKFEAPRKFDFDEKFYSIINHIPKHLVDLRLSNAFSMYYSTYESNKLKCEYERDISDEYDYVMKIRFDLLFDYPLIFSNYSKNKLTYSNHHWEHPICFTNIWALGSSSIMDCYAGTYHTMSENIENKRMDFTDECILGRHIHDCGIEKNPITFNTRILRLKGVAI